ncbi:MAG: hypothetical protein RIB67_08145 [Miltoncostaeaceae bacterium]
MATKKKKKNQAGGRRANYAPAATQSGNRKYLPVGWANWLGFVMFSIIAVALGAEAVAGVIEGRGADPAAAAVLFAGFAYMTYLFGTIRLKD